MISVYSEQRTKPINKLYEQNAQFVNVKVRGAYMYHWVVTGVGTTNMSVECFVFVRSRTQISALRQAIVIENASILI
jgi:hypothetical protein